jgi:F0F1-type ATP synthase membrane subunit b/b'
VITLNPRIAARTIAGETLILTPHDSVLHTLNAVGTRIWQLLPQAESLDAIAQTLHEEYEVSVEEARQDVAELIDTFIEKGIAQA